MSARSKARKRALDVLFASDVRGESATTALEPRLRPVRRCAQDRNGMMSNDSEASTIPTVE